MPKPETRASGKYFPFTDFDFTGHKQRLGITNSKRFQGFKFSNQRKPNRCKAQLGIDVEAWKQILSRFAVPCHALEGFGKQSEFFFLYRQSSGVFVTAKLFQVIST